MAYFRYGQTEIEYLQKKDKKLAAAIDHIGMIEREVTPDLFTALVHSVVGQQISTKAFITVWNRLVALLGQITPERILTTPIEDIQQSGISMRKASYIRGIAEKVSSGELNIMEFPKLSDEEIIKRLSALNGIGVWTAEMLLIFSMERPDVLSWGDLAIHRGLMKLYGHKQVDKVKFEKYRKRYSPYCSVASLYLWEISHPDYSTNV